MVLENYLRDKTVQRVIVFMRKGSGGLSNPESDWFPLSEYQVSTNSGITYDMVRLGEDPIELAKIYPKLILIYP